MRGFQRIAADLGKLFRCRFRLLFIDTTRV